VRTHCGAFDTTYLASLPGFVVMAAADEAELRHMVRTAAVYDDGPISFRYPRGNGVGVDMPDRGSVLEIGTGRILREVATGHEEPWQQRGIRDRDRPCLAPHRDERILHDALNELEKRRRDNRAPLDAVLWRALMKNKIIRFGTAFVVIIIALVAFQFLGNPFETKVTFASAIEPILNAGTLTYAGSGVKATGPASTTAAGEIVVTVRAKGKKRKTLNDKGKVTVKPKITFTPTNGTAAVSTKKVKLKKG
jgi:hypothetical protein